MNNKTQRVGRRVVALAVVGSVLLATTGLMVGGGNVMGPSERVRQEVALRSASDPTTPAIGVPPIGGSSAAAPTSGAPAGAVEASADDEEIVLVNQLIRDIGATPAAVLGVSLFLLGTVLAPTGLGGAIAPVYGVAVPPVLELYGTTQGTTVAATQSAGDAIAGAGPVLNPIIEPAATAVAQALEDQAPGAGTTLTFRDHFGLAVEDSSSSSVRAAGGAPEGAAGLNYSVTARGSSTFGGADVPAAEAAVRASNGYLNTSSGLNSGLAGALLYTPLFFYGGNLVPRPFAAQAVYPSGPLQSSKPFVRPGQSEMSSFGAADANVTELAGDAHMRALRFEVPGLVTVGSVENSVEFLNEGSVVSTVSTALLDDVEIAGGVIRIKQLRTDLRVTGTGRVEDRKVEATPTIVGLEVAGTPIVLVADGWVVAGSAALTAAEKKALEAQVAAALEQSGLRLAAGTVDATDAIDDNGVVTNAVASAIRVTQVTDGEVAQDIGLAYTSAKVFTAPKPAFDFSFDAGSALPPLDALDAAPAPPDRAAPSAMPSASSAGAEVAAGPAPSTGPELASPAVIRPEFDPIAVAAKLEALTGVLALLAIFGLAAPFGAARYLGSARVRGWRPEWATQTRQPPAG